MAAGLNSNQFINSGSGGDILYTVRVVDTVSTEQFTLTVFSSARQASLTETIFDNAVDAFADYLHAETNLNVVSRTRTTSSDTAI